MFGEGAQRAVPGDLLEYRQGAALVFQLPDAGVAQLVKGPSGGVGEAFGGPPVGQACPAGGGVFVSVRYRGVGAAAGEEEGAVVPPGGEPGEQVGGVGVPVDGPGDAALAGYGGGLGIQVEVGEVQAEQLAGPGRGVVGQAPEGLVPQGDVTPAPQGLKLAGGDDPAVWGRPGSPGPPRGRWDRGRG